MFFLFHFYFVRWRVLENRGQTEKKVTSRWKTYGMYWLCKLSLQNSFRNSPKVSISLNKLFGLIWTQTVWKGYQQMTEVSKVFHMSMKVLCIGSHYMLKLCFNVRPSEYDQKIHMHRLLTRVRISNNSIKCLYWILCMVTKWIKYRLALFCKTRGKPRVHNHWVWTTWRNNTIKCWLSRFCMIIQDSNISRLWRVKASENNQEISQSQVANWFAFNIGHSDSIFYHQSKHRWALLWWVYLLEKHLLCLIFKKEMKLVYLFDMR